MSLNIYRKRNEVPKGMKIVDVNDGFFDADTMIEDTELIREILRTIDKAEYDTEAVFNSRSDKFKHLNKACLSTGTKTLLNIISHPNRCFNVIECGNNALEFLPQITEGNILFEHPVVAFSGNETCDIMYKGVRYTDFYEFLQYVYEEEEG